MASPEPQDVVQTGLDLLIDFWSDKPVAQGLLISKLKEIQELEDVVFQLLNERSVTTAVGEQLNVVGYLVGEERLGREDETFRQAILNRIGLNRADGTPPVVLDTLSNFSGSTVPNIFEHFPASLHGYVDTGGSHALARTLQEVSAAGVDTRLMFDVGGDSFVGCELEETDDLFTFEGGFTFSTDNAISDPLFSTLGYIDTLTSDRTFLPEEGEDSLNPFCEMLDSRLLTIQVGLFENGDGSIFEFEGNSMFQWEIVQEN